MVQIRNIAAKQIQFNKINKSNCTLSFQHGIHLSQVSTKTCKFVKCCIEQIRRLKMSMIEIRNIAAKQIQLKKVTNPTVQRASRKVTKPKKGSQEALL